MRKSELGKLYDKVQTRVEEDAWVDELVSNIIDDITYCIEVEKQTLPFEALMSKSILPRDVENDVGKVIYALYVKGVIASSKEYEVGKTCFVINDLI